MPKQVVLTIVTFLHDLFTAVWVGGLITLGIAFLPAAKQTLGKGIQMRDLMDAVQKRLSTFVYVSIVGLTATGILLSNRTSAFKGLLRFGNIYSTALSIKHVLVLLMIGIALYRSLVLGRRPGPSPTTDRLSAGLLVLNMTLGILVLLLSGFSTALSAGLGRMTP